MPIATSLHQAPCPGLGYIDLINHNTKPFLPKFQNLGLISLIGIGDVVTQTIAMSERLLNVAKA